MKAWRTAVLALSAAAILATFAFTVWQTLKTRRLEAAVSAARIELATLRKESRRTGIPAEARGSDVRAPAGDPTSGAEVQFPASGISRVTADDLKGWLVTRPELFIPEIGMLDDTVWQEAAASVRPGSDADFLQAVRVLRHHARRVFGEAVASALQSYSEAHNGTLPVTVAELAPYLGGDSGEAMLRRHALLFRGELSRLDPDTPIIGEVEGVDDELDSVLSVSQHALTRVTADRMGAEIQRALYRFLSASGGQLPGAVAEVAPFLGFPVPEQILNRYVLNNDLSVSLKK